MALLLSAKNSTGYRGVTRERNRFRAVSRSGSNTTVELGRYDSAVAAAVAVAKHVEAEEAKGGAEAERAAEARAERDAERKAARKAGKKAAAGAKGSSTEQRGPEAADKPRAAAGGAAGSSDDGVAGGAGGSKGGGGSVYNPTGLPTEHEGVKLVLSPPRAAGYPSPQPYTPGPYPDPWPTPTLTLNPDPDAEPSLQAGALRKERHGLPRRHARGKPLHRAPVCAGGHGARTWHMRMRMHMHMHTCSMAAPVGYH